ncbi:MAG TPA: hypothetical protein VK324_14910 [Tepidisphaeraceae bacterium]|nr:hypothetical protein [Tepidisphaeraceae bacterium]
MRTDNDVLATLRWHGVRFAVIGGHAVIFHGYARSTEDIDVVWERSPDAERALLAALVELDAQYLGNDVDPATGLERAHPVGAGFVQANHLMMLLTRCGFVDLFDYVPGVPDADVTDLLRDSVEVNGVRFASLAWLRRMKRAANRAKDMADLEALGDDP